MVKEDIKIQVEHYAKLPYTTVIERMEDQGVYYVARVLELDGLIMTGETPEEAVAELESVKKEWIESYLEQGNKMPKPLKSRKYSGQYRIRMEPSLHEKLALLAEHEGISLNQFMVTRLAQAAGSQTHDEIYDVIDKINNRIRELVQKSGVGFYDNGDIIRESTLTQEEKQEKSQLRAFLKLLNKIDDDTRGINTE